MDDSSGITLHRRDFVIAGATSAVAVALPSLIAGQPSAPAPPVLEKAAFTVKGVVER